LELRELLRILWSRKVIALAVFAIVFLTIVIGTLLVTPWYDATAKVLIRRSSGASSLLSALGLSGSQVTVSTTISDTDRADFLALAQVKPVIDKVIAKKPIRSERVRGRILKALPFLKPVLRTLGVDVESTMKTLTAEDLLEPSLLTKIFPLPYVEAEQYEATNIIDLTAYSPEPAQATELANDIAAAFVADELARVRGDYQGAKAFIDGNLAQAHGRYLESLTKLKDFKERNNTLSVDVETSNVLQRISDLKKQITDVGLGTTKTQASIRRIEAYLQSVPKYQLISEQLQSNEMLLNFKVVLRDLYLSLAETKTKYTDDHPNVIDIRNKIDKAQELLQQEVKKTFNSETKGIDATYQDLSNKLSAYYGELAAYESQEMTLPKMLQNYETEMMTFPEKSFQYSQAQLQLTMNQDLYNSLLKYQSQLELAESMALINISVVEPAISPLLRKSLHQHPSTAINFLLALVLGSVIAICAAFFAEYLDTTIREGEDLKSFGPLVFLGAIPKVGKDAGLIDDETAPPHLREAFRALRAGIRFAALDRPLKTLVVTSPGRKEGKSFVAANLAIAAAQEGMRVLIIDGNLRSPGVHIAFGLANDTGLAGHLAAGAGVEDVLVSTRVEGLQAITAGPLPRDPGKLVGSATMQRLLEVVKERYDLVVVDSPPVLMASDVRILASWADATLIVVESGRTERRALPETLDLLQTAKAAVIGVVIDKASGRDGSYTS